MLVVHTNHFLQSSQPIKSRLTDKRPITSGLRWPIRLTTRDVYIPPTDVPQFTWLWRWLPLRLSKRQSKSPQTVLLRTTHTRMIIIYVLKYNINSVYWTDKYRCSKLLDHEESVPALEFDTGYAAVVTAPRKYIAARIGDVSWQFFSALFGATTPTEQEVERDAKTFCLQESSLIFAPFFTMSRDEVG